MLKKVQLVFVVGLLFVLLLQMLEISNLGRNIDTILNQKKLIFTLNSVAIGILALYVIISLRTSFSFWSKKKMDNSTQNEILTEQENNSNQITDYTQDDRLKNLENKLAPLLSRCNSSEEVCTKFLSVICSEFKLAQGILFVRKKETDEFYIKGTFAYYNENTGYSFRIGEGICGQVAKNQKAIILTNIPDNYVHIVSGLGLGSPKYLQVVPIIFANEVIGVMELASFTNELLQTNDMETGVLKQLSNSLKGFL